MAFGAPTTQGLRQGARVQMSASKLRQGLLFDSKTCLLITAETSTDLVGHAFVCRYAYPDKVTHIF